MKKDKYAAFVIQFAEGVYFRGFHPGFLNNKRIFITRKLIQAKRFDRENLEEFENAWTHLDNLDVRYDIAICLFKREE